MTSLFGYFVLAVIGVLGLVSLAVWWLLSHRTVLNFDPGLMWAAMATCACGQHKIRQCGHVWGVPSTWEDAVTGNHHHADGSEIFHA